MGGLGFHPTVIERPRNKLAAARAALARCQFDEEDCGLGLRRLRAYRKEWDEGRGVWKDRPRHDDASHGADAFPPAPAPATRHPQPSRTGSETSDGWFDQAARQVRRIV